MAAVYDLTIEQLCAKAAERDGWAENCRELDRVEEAAAHERMAGLYRLRIRQIKRTEKEGA